MNNTGEESFYDLISDDENVIDMMGQLSACVQGRLYSRGNGFFDFSVIFQIIFHH